MSGFQEDLVVEDLPLGVISHGNSKLANAGHQMFGDSLLVHVLSAQHVLQLRVEPETSRQGSKVKHLLWRSTDKERISLFESSTMAKQIGSNQVQV